jgi:flagellar hook-associated protein 3 FlgL
MRVTLNMLYNKLVENIHQSMGRLQELQTKISTGKKIGKSSDDPIGSIRALYNRTNLGEIEQFEKNIQDITTNFNISEQSLQEVINKLREARIVAIQGANETSSEGRRAIADTINELIKGMLEVGNTEYGGRYLFGGTKTQAQPFIADIEDQPGKIFYRGDNKILYSEIGLNSLFPLNLPGDKIFRTEHFHTIRANKKVADTRKVLNQVLEGGFSGPVSFEISLEGVTPTVVTIDPQAQSLEDLMEEINTRNQNKEIPIRAEIDSDNRLVIFSTVEGREGNIKIRDIDGLLERLGIANSKGEIIGEQEISSEEDGIFETLIKLRDYLLGRAEAENQLIHLRDAKGRSLGLKSSDRIIIDIDGNIKEFKVGNEINTLSDLARGIQGFARSNGYPTLIVLFKRGRLTFINPAGEGARDISNISIRGISQSGEELKVFNEVMASLGGIAADGSTTTSSLIDTEEQGKNLSSIIGDIDRNIDNVLSVVSEVGTKLQRLESTKNKLADTKVVIQKLLSENEDIDLPKAILEFQTQQNIYQAALLSATKIVQANLFDFLR